MRVIVASKQVTERTDKNKGVCHFVMKSKIIAAPAYQQKCQASRKHREKSKSNAPVKSVVKAYASVKNANKKHQKVCVVKNGYFVACFKRSARVYTDVRNFIVKIFQAVKLPKVTKKYL